ncbi:hypothetical protein DRE_02614 [Drechslerella stenobrocha 248]|uniref:Uncharacterized protein n=1 Tax=Drechslerella stenobrocha 248 TaxID=1043628 RepID=W7IFV6_9PEZI|nr:hypothetical protein DRE_02614 [Drechslerella stenobrocha 248]
MQFTVALTIALNLVGAAFALPAGSYDAVVTDAPPTLTTDLAPACTTFYTVTTDYPETVTVYEQYAAVPLELICGDCELEVVTVTTGEPRTPVATVTEEYTLMYIPLCTVFPTEPTDTPEY